MYRLCYAALTHPGRVRENNEDNFYIDGNFKSDVSESVKTVSGIARAGVLTAAVCDGMGGYACGEQASLTAVATLAEFDHGRSGRSRHGCIDEANRRICDVIQRDGRRMGTTLSMLEFHNRSVRAVNLGDSHIYRYRKGVLELLSVDHSSVAQMVRMGQITPEEARMHPARHQITQYLGIAPEEMILEPARSGKLPLMDGDMYLVCSDGLTDMLDDPRIAEIIGAKEKAGTKAVVGRLVREALNAGGLDNITVILIKAVRVRTVFFRLI